jgi:hypothetical protein
MTRTLVAIILTVALAAVVGVSALVGWLVPPDPETNGGFNWELAAVIMTGVGTTLLAAATGALAFSTWQDVRASQVLAEAALEANEQARSTETSRPDVRLVADNDRLHTRAETNAGVWVRLLAGNAPGRRAAAGTRVLVVHYRAADGNHPPITLGSPSLGWPSAADAVDRSLTIFGGTERPVDLGALVRTSPHSLEPAYVIDMNALPPAVSDPWYLELAVGLDIANHRQLIPPSLDGWIIRLVTGATEAATRTYDVSIRWDGMSNTAADALDSVAVSVSPVD